MAVAMLVSAAGAAVTPYDAIGRLPIDDINRYIIHGLGDFGNRNFGVQPTIAVNPLDPSKMVVHTGIYNTNPAAPFYQGAACLWYTSDGGVTWGLRFPITQPLPGVNVPYGETIAYDRNGVLHGAFIGRTFPFINDFNVYHGQTPDPNSDGKDGRPPNAWVWPSGGARINWTAQNTADMPWLAVGARIGATTQVAVHVGYDNWLSDFIHSEQRVVTSEDGGATFLFAGDRTISNGGQLLHRANPSTRIAMDSAGRAYSLFAWADTLVSPGIQHVQYSLNRWSGGAGWDFTANNPAPGGIIVDQGTALLNSCSSGLTKFGGINRLLCAATDIAVSRDGQHVYTVLGKRENGIDKIFVCESHPDPNNSANLLTGPPVLVSQISLQSALPGAAVTDDGKLWIMYDQFDPNGGVFTVRLASSTDLGHTFSDELLHSFTSPIADNGDCNQVVLGHYQSLMALGNSVYGCFAGRGSVTNSIIDTTNLIVPFVFSTVACGSADFNGDGDTGTDADIEAFFACLGGTCCAACGSADFNGDGDVGTDADIEAFFRVLAGGSC
jgi:hypothetical protein